MRVTVLGTRVMGAGMGRSLVRASHSGSTNTQPAAKRKKRRAKKSKV